VTRWPRQLPRSLVTRSYTPAIMGDEVLDRIVIDPRIMLGKPIVEGTRITVEAILDRMAAGADIAAVLKDYPELTREDVLGALAYARGAVGTDEILPRIINVGSCCELTGSASSTQLRRVREDAGVSPQFEAEASYEMRPDCDLSEGMRRRDRLLRLLEGHRLELRQLGVERIGIFGSRARGDAGPCSDVDVLVKFRSGAKTYNHYMDVKETLEALTGAPVDLVLEEALKPALRQAVLAETVYAAQF
jgi:uncharacterized protein